MKVSLLLAPGQGTIHHDSGHTWAHDSNYAVSGIIKVDGRTTSKSLIKSGQVDRNQHKSSHRSFLCGLISRP